MTCFSRANDFITLVKEVDPCVWLIFLEKEGTFALYNMLTEGVIKCTLSALKGITEPICDLKIHPDFYMG